jgi:hypothetical protein
MNTIRSLQSYSVHYCSLVETASTFLQTGRVTNQLLGRYHTRIDTASLSKTILEPISLSNRDVETTPSTERPPVARLRILYDLSNQMVRVSHVQNLYL